MKSLVTKLQDWPQRLNPSIKERNIKRMRAVCTGSASITRWAIVGNATMTNSNPPPNSRADTQREIIMREDYATIVMTNKEKIRRPSDGV